MLFCTRMSIDLRPYSAQELRELSDKNAHELSKPIVKRWYDYVLGQAKIGRKEATIELYSIFDELSNVNYYVLNQLETLFPDCHLHFQHKALMRGEYVQVYKLSW